jgi:hypothetical protein
VPNLFSLSLSRAHLHSKHEAPSSSSSTTTKKPHKKQRLLQDIYLPTEKSHILFIFVYQFFFLKKMFY